VLKQLDGYKIENGAIVPDKVVSKVSATAITPATAQVPLMFGFSDTDAYLFALNSSYYQTLCDITYSTQAGVWNTANTSKRIPADDSVPARVGKLIAWPTQGADSRIAACDPDSMTTKMWLSLGSPTDYDPGNKPAITASSFAGAQLFGCGNGSPWVCPTLTGFSVANPTGTATPSQVLYDCTPSMISASSTLTIADTVVASGAHAQVVTRDLGATGIDPTGKVYLVMDIKITGDEQAIYDTGVFTNDSSLYPSGYMISLYEDQPNAGTHLCSTPIATYHIPQCLPLGKVARIALNLGGQTTVIKGVAISTSASWIKPAAGTTYTLTLYSGTFADDWGFLGNYLMPAVVWQGTDLAKSLAQSPPTFGTVVTPAGGNVLTVPGFEASGTWSYTHATRSTARPRSDLRAALIPDSVFYGSGSVVQTTVAGAVVPSVQHTIEVWYVTPKKTIEWRIKIQGITAGGANVGAETLFPASGYYSSDKSSAYRLKTESWTPVATAVNVKITIETHDVYKEDAFYVDDVAIYKTDQTTTTSCAWVMEHLDEALTNRDPGPYYIEYSYCFLASLRPGLLPSVSGYRDLMTSNPSDPSSPSTYADPWRTYGISTSCLSGPLPTTLATVLAGGTGYVTGDVLAVDGGTDGKIKVTAPAGVVTGFAVLNVGTGYSETSSTKDTSALTGSGTGCQITAYGVAPYTDEGRIFAHTIYRRIYTPVYEEDGVWSSWDFYCCAPMLVGTASATDIGPADEAIYAGIELPSEMPITNTKATSARYATYADTRVYAACLDWDNQAETWLRPLQLQVSWTGKPYAFPTIPDENDPTNSGGELTVPTSNGYEIRGILATKSAKFVWTDRDFWMLRGDNPENWQFVQLDTIGCVSNKTAVDCRGQVIWHDGKHFCLYNGSTITPISRFRIDSTLIDWTATHNAVFCDDQYFCLCKYNGALALLIYDLVYDSWRIRTSTSLSLVGICTDGQYVYGLTTTGYVVNVFGNTSADYPSATVSRTVETQPIVLCELEDDIDVTGLALDVDAKSSATLSPVLSVQGKADASQTLSIPVVTTTDRYEQKANLAGTAVSVALTVAGDTINRLRGLGPITGRTRAR
jgi:hypothetical protein